MGRIRTQFMYCILKNCKTNNRKTVKNDVKAKEDLKKKLGALSFHTFPQDESLRKAWENAIISKMDEKNQPSSLIMSPNSRLCSEHFKETDYTSSLTAMKRLLPNSVPSKFEEAPILKELKIESTHQSPELRPSGVSIPSTCLENSPGKTVQLCPLAVNLPNPVSSTYTSYLKYSSRKKLHLNPSEVSSPSASYLENSSRKGLNLSLSAVSRSSCSSISENFQRKRLKLSPLLGNVSSPSNSSLKNSQRETVQLRPLAVNISSASTSNQSPRVEAMNCSPTKSTASVIQAPISPLIDVEETSQTPMVISKSHQLRRKRPFVETETCSDRSPVYINRLLSSDDIGSSSVVKQIKAIHLNHTNLDKTQDPLTLPHATQDTISTVPSDIAQDCSHQNISTPLEVSRQISKANVGVHESVVCSEKGTSTRRPFLAQKRARIIVHLKNRIEKLQKQVQDLLLQVNKERPN